jgi:hypothetical protein
MPRSASLAGADFVFSRDGSPQTNPGNLSFDTTNDASLSYASYYKNTFSSSIFSFAGAIDSLSGYGISFSYLYVPDIMGTKNLLVDQDGIPIYDESRMLISSYSDIYFHVGYGRKMFTSKVVELAGGVSVNAQRQRLAFDGYRGYSIGLDAGAVANFPASGVRLSLACENITTQYTKWSANYSETAYPHLRFGAGWQKDLPYIYGRFQIQYKTLDLLGNEGADAIDATTFLTTVSNDQSQDASNSSTANQMPGEKPSMSNSTLSALLGSIGIEYLIKEIFAIRVGGNFQNPAASAEQKFAFGCGVNLFRNSLSIDASYALHELAATYQIGMTYPR